MKTHINHKLKVKIFCLVFEPFRSSRLVSSRLVSSGEEQQCNEKCSFRGSGGMFIPIQKFEMIFQISLYPIKNFKYLFGVTELGYYTVLILVITWLIQLYRESMNFAGMNDFVLWMSSGWFCGTLCSITLLIQVTKWEETVEIFHRRFVRCLIFIWG